MMRALLNNDEFSAIAFGRSARPTICTMKDWRAGMSKAFTTPSSPARTRTCDTWTVPDNVIAARAKASSIMTACVPTMMRWRRQRSAAKPPTGARRNTGNCPMKPTSPNRTDDCVSRYTSQAWATFCIHVPITEMNWPAKKSW